MTDRPQPLPLAEAAAQAATALRGHTAMVEVECAALPNGRRPTCDQVETALRAALGTPLPPTWRGVRAGVKAFGAGTVFVVERVR